MPLNPSSPASGLNDGPDGEAPPRTNSITAPALQTHKPTAEQLSRMRAFSRLGGAALSLLAEASSGRVVRRRSGAPLRGVLGGGAGFVLKGAISVHWLTPSALVCDLYTALPGESLELGECFAAAQSADGMRLFAREPSVLAIVPRNALLEALALEPQLGAAIATELAGEARHFKTRAFELSTLDLRGRLVAELLRLANEAQPAPGGETIIGAAPTQLALAARVAATRESVTRQLRALEADGLIRHAQGAIVIPNLSRLAALDEAAGGRRGSPLNKIAR